MSKRRRPTRRTARAIAAVRAPSKPTPIVAQLILDRRASR